jgi:hypothetical protein
MKKIIFSIIAVLLITGCTPPKEEIDVAKEEEAIKAALKEEMTHFLNRDYVSEAEYVKKADYVRTIDNTGNFHQETVGWDSVFVYLKRASEQDWSEVSNYKIEHEDFNIKVYDKIAWAAYKIHGTGEYKKEPFDFTNSRVTFLEKVDENWKIVLMTSTLLNPCKGEAEDNDEEGDEDE